MKIRQSFVSNSSSSSFICDVCGEIESGWDAVIEDFDMYECENAHLFCKDHMNMDKYYEWKGEEDESHYNIPESLCPICTMQDVTLDDIQNYIAKEYGHSYEKIEAEIKERFLSYGNLQEFFRK